MDETIISNFNEVVGKNDTTIHAGDFTFQKGDIAWKILDQLNGDHILLKGNHDYFLKGNKNIHEIWEKNIHHQLTQRKYHVVVSHWCLRTWNRSHFNSFHLYGHSHGTLPPIGKSWDVGVDCNNFCPVSFDQVIDIMANRPDNPNRVGRGGERIESHCIVCGSPIECVIDPKFKNDPLVYMCSDKCEQIFQERK